MTFDDLVKFGAFLTVAVTAFGSIGSLYISIRTYLASEAEKKRQAVQAQQDAAQAAKDKSELATKKELEDLRREVRRGTQAIAFYIEYSGYLVGELSRNHWSYLSAVQFARARDYDPDALGLLAQPVNHGEKVAPVEAEND